MPAISRRVFFANSAAAVALLLVQVGCSPVSSTSSVPGSGPAAGANKPFAPAAKGKVELLNVSYDPTRELWGELNQAFKFQYQKETGVEVKINPSHGGSGKQAQAIVNGLKADVATLSIWSDTEQLHKAGLLKDGWEEKLPNHSLAYTSTVVFVVRKGNPKGIKEWKDLVEKPGIGIVTPDPKTSGNGKLSLLSAWGSVVLNGGSEEEATKFLTEMYKRVEKLDSGARAATVTFSQKGVGDVHLTMESEAYLEVAEAKGNLEIVVPSQSILHEPQIAIVDEVVDRRGTREIAEAYLKSLYTDEGQEIIARHHFRPTNPDILAKHKAEFGDLKLFPITDLLKGGWSEAQSKFFADGALFDQIQKPKK